MLPENSILRRDGIFVSKTWNRVEGRGCKRMYVNNMYLMLFPRRRFGITGVGGSVMRARGYGYMRVFIILDL